MSDLLATALGLGFAMLVCLLAVQAILSPWLRVRRAPGTAKRSAPYSNVDASAQETAVAQSAS